MSVTAASAAADGPTLLLATITIEFQREGRYPKTPAAMTNREREVSSAPYSAHQAQPHCPLLPGLLCLSVLFLALRYE